MYAKLVKLFLRLAIALGFLSAVADRFGFWSYHIAWGNWQSFVDYTTLLLPWLPEKLVVIVAVIATVAEIVFAIFLLIGWRIKIVAILSGVLLLLFAIGMATSTGIKTVFDASVLAASSACFALSIIKFKYLELK